MVYEDDIVLIVSGVDTSLVVVMCKLPPVVHSRSIIICGVEEVGNEFLCLLM